MKHLLPLLVVGSTLLLTPVAQAAGQATPDEAKAMAIKAAEYLKSAGQEKAFPEFNAKDGPWHDRDLYVTVEDSKGVMVAHGTNAGLIGKSMLDLKDVDGKRSIVRFRRSRTSAGSPTNGKIPRPRQSRRRQPMRSASVTTSSEWVPTPSNHTLQRGSARHEMAQ